MAEYAALAAASLSANLAAPAQGSPAAGSEPAPEPVAPVAEPAPAPEPAAATPDDPEAEPLATADEMATWTEGERKLHGALVKEREKRKEAKAELKALRETLEQLQAKATPAPNAEPSATEPASAPVNQPVTGALPADPLGDCNTFEAVDARAMQAATTEATVVRLQTQLAREGVEAVKATLAKQGVKELAGQPLEHVEEHQVTDFLARVYEGARVTQIAAEPRKRFIAGQQQAFQEATQLIPELKDGKSEAAKQFTKLLHEVPMLPQLGAHWPKVAAIYLLGQQVAIKQAKPAAPSGPVVPPPAAPARTVPPPSAPSRSTAALPAARESDALSEKIRNGTASLAEVAQYARSGLTGT